MDSSNSSQGPQGICGPCFENHSAEDVLGFPEIPPRIYKFLYIGFSDKLECVCANTWRTVVGTEPCTLGPTFPPCPAMLASHLEVVVMGECRAVQGACTNEKPGRGNQGHAHGQRGFTARISTYKPGYLKTVNEKTFHFQI